MKILVTGAAGFVGAHLCNQILKAEHELVGIDDFNDYYSAKLKEDRCQYLLGRNSNLIKKIGLNDINDLRELIRSFKPDIVIHLAAQAGVRLPRQQYRRYIDSNLTGFTNICSLIDEFSIKNFLYASSSSVYGNSSQRPFKEETEILRPISLYGLTKKINEEFATSFFKNSKTKVIGMRFFTIYGPWGRPDMAYFRLLNSLMNGAKFVKYGDGNLLRDFTYVDDTVNSILRLTKNCSEEREPVSEIFNIGGGKPFSLNQFIEKLENKFGKRILIEQQDSSVLDVNVTDANYDKLQKYIDFHPEIDLDKGIDNLFQWSEEVGSKLMKHWI